MVHVFDIYLGENPDWDKVVARHILQNHMGKHTVMDVEKYSVLTVLVAPVN